MKVTAIIPDELILEVQKLTGAKNITQSIIVVLDEWIRQQKLLEINQRLKKQSIKFIKNFDTAYIRTLRNQK